MLLGASGDVGFGGDRPAGTMAASVTVRTIEAAAPAVETAAAGLSEPMIAASQVPDASSVPRGLRWTAEKASARSQESLLGSGLPEPSPPESPQASGDTAPTSTEAPPAFATTALARPDLDPPDVATESSMMRVALEVPRATMASFLGAGEIAPPTYRTVLPGPATLLYELRRGVFRGTGEIRWRPSGDRYALQFDARLAGVSLLAQSSQGELGVNGLDPVRFVDQRARKAARAVNFSRTTGSISFSASTAQWPLLAGTQDRLSWMIQLGGIVAADPDLASAGRITMVLVSARGEASVRSARFAGREDTQTVAGSVPALKFVVDGHSAYDGSFEIWLDPAHGYLPVHATSRGSSGEAEFELLLQRVDP